VVEEPSGGRETFRWLRRSLCDRLETTPLGSGWAVEVVEVAGTVAGV
jgi:hypothetical protein